MSGRPNDKMFKTMVAKHGSEEAAREWFRDIGSQGGKLGKTGGFASNKVGKDGLTGRERSKLAGIIGGKISRRGPALSHSEVQEVKAILAEPTQTAVKKRSLLQKILGIGRI